MNNQKTKNMKNHPLNNHAVQVLSVEHGEQVIKAFKDSGVNTSNLNGDVFDFYYGIFDGEFSCKIHLPLFCKEITLEELKDMRWLNSITK